MEKEKGKWEDIIRSKVYDFEADTNPDDWEIISRKLSSGGKIFTLKPYRRFGYVAAAAVAALIIAGGLYFYQDDDKAADSLAVVEKPVDNMVEKSADIVDKVVEEVEKPAGNIEKSVEKAEKIVESVGKSVDEKVEKPVDSSLKASAKDNKTPREARFETDDEPPVKLRPLPLDDDDMNINNVPDIDVNAIEKDILYGFNDIKPEEVPLTQQAVADASKETKRRRWGFGMGGGGYTASSTSGALGVQPYSTALDYDEYMYKRGVMMLRSSEDGPSIKSLVNSTSVDDSERVAGKVKHKTPISAGLGVSYYLNDRWALQSGVVYTLLRSKGSYYDNIGNAADWKQNLHYLGVPLSLSYKIAEWNRLQLYASAGGMFEINVAGKFKESLYIEDLKVNTSKKVRMEEPLWSVNTRAGVAYPLWKFINVYAEAGASYYFDNKSNMETIRSDKPFNVSLQAGFRLGF